MRVKVEGNIVASSSICSVDTIVQIKIYNTLQINILPHSIFLSYFSTHYVA